MDEQDQIAAAERLGYPYLVYRDHLGSQQVLSLQETWERITIGRGAGTDLALAWDSEVSRVHAELTRLGEDWVLVDDGLSSNGTFVNGERIERRRRLFDGDELRFGETDVRFRAPLQAIDATEIVQTPVPKPPAS
jgi:pSer/pThr/pTyr-binding forkhead associated (FHA) protein